MTEGGQRYLPSVSLAKKRPRVASHKKRSRVASHMATSYTQAVDSLLGVSQRVNTWRWASFKRSSIS
jgi:hypothetical protein